MHGVAAFFEGGARGSQVVPAATNAVDENDVLDLGHATKGDSHSAQASPKRVSVRAAARRAGNPPPVRGLHQFAQHTSRITAGAGTWNGGWPFTRLHPPREKVPAQTRNVVGRLKVAAPVSTTNATAVGFAVNGSACHQ